jgi:hypothetical protein
MLKFKLDHRIIWVFETQAELFNLLVFKLKNFQNFFIFFLLI